MGDHEIRAGFDMKNYTYRTYGLGTGAMYNINRMIALGEVTRDEANSGTNDLVTQELSQSNRGGQIGYDDYGNEVDSDDLAGPRKPSTTSLYVNDKYEAGDVVVSAGVRVDMFNMDDYKLNDTANPPWDETNRVFLLMEFLSQTPRPRYSLA